MTTYLRILSYVRKHWLHLSGSLISIIFFTLFSCASLISIIPFLKEIFQQDSSLVDPEQFVVVKVLMPSQHPLADIDADENVAHEGHVRHRERSVQFHSDSGDV